MVAIQYAVRAQRRSKQTLGWFVDLARLSLKDPSPKSSKKRIMFLVADMWLGRVPFRMVIVHAMHTGMFHRARMVSNGVECCALRRAIRLMVNHVCACSCWACKACLISGHPSYLPPLDTHFRAERILCCGYPYGDTGNRSFSLAAFQEKMVWLQNC